MSDLSRVEQLLRNALGEDIYEVTPQSRVEALLVELNELIEGMGGSVSPEDIATAVAAYLDEHLTNPTNPPIDTSLSIAGAAADAKKTGDELSDLKEGLSEMSTATSSDVGKALKVKTVADGKVTEWEFGEAGASVELDATLTDATKAAQAKAVGDRISAIENLESQRGTVAPTFVQGSISQSTGAFDDSSTTNCRTDKLDVFTGDVLQYTRANNKITTSATIVYYDSNGNYISGTSIATPATITIESDGQIALRANLNSGASATMDEAIQTADNSFLLTTKQETEIVKSVKDLDARVSAIESADTEKINKFVDDVVIKDGIEITKDDLTVGKMYTVTNGVVTLGTNTASKYCNKIDVSEYVGQKCIVKFNTVRGGSTRALGFCDASNNVESFLTESALVKMGDGTWRGVIIVDAQYLFISCSTDVTELSISVVPEYAFASKNELNTALTRKKYYHFSFDDVILCLKDITDNSATYTSIFDNGFFAWLKSMHDKYGVKISLYVFYADDATTPTWTLADCTNKFASEFTKNAEWLKFGFHAYAQGTTAESREPTIASDYNATITQLIRITGSVGCIDRMPRLQNYNGTLASLTVLRDCDAGCVGFIASQDYSDTSARDSYYFDAAQNAYINKHCYMFDYSNDLAFVKTSWVWNASAIDVVTIENSAKWANANKYVEIFLHEDQLTDGNKNAFEKKLNCLSYSHLPMYMMELFMC